MTTEAQKHQTRLRVRYVETDQMGVVHHANYLVWLEIGRVELVRSRGCNYKELEEREGLFLSVVDVNCRYYRPAKYDQEVVIQTEILAAGSRVVDFGYEIRTADPDRLLVKATTRHVWLNREWRATQLPEQYRHLLRIG
jgi:acyl-CoA thioester hydrolase